MTAEHKIAKNRLTLLQLAEKLRNISEACRRRGVSCSQFYKYKRAFREHGFEGLKQLVCDFARGNTCDRCFTAIRANSEKSPYRLLVDALRVISKSNNNHC
jgi:hypothetical protein